MSRLACCVALSLLGCGAQPPDAAVEEAVTLCPGPATVEGIDTSSWQGAIDWNAVRQSGRGFAIARISDGLAHPDAQFARDWPAIAGAGLVRGAYQFFRPSQDPSAQADLVVRALAQAGGLGATDLPPILDLETTDGVAAADVVARAHLWLDAVEARTGKRPMVYTAAFMSSILGTSFAPWPLWVANYGAVCPRLPSGWTSWRIWQYDDAGRVAGIAGGVDLDRFDGSANQLRAFAAASDVGIWSCARSAWRGAQFWTCVDGKLHRCSDAVPELVTCAHGCTVRALGTDDTCN